MTEITQLDPDARAAVERFLARVPEGDRTFFKEDVTDADVLDAWTRPGSTRWLAVEDGEVIGYAAVIPLQGWSSHVGEVRVVVDAEHRHRGIGGALARHVLRRGLELGLSKFVVEVVAEEEGTVALFRSLGFEPEALLRDHVRDRSGRVRDLLILAHPVGEAYAGLVASGVVEDLGG
jgi:L-amino acid N-acyltransferase YncA